jgi:hypothetical protein
MELSLRTQRHWNGRNAIVRWNSKTHAVRRRCLVRAAVAVPGPAKGPAAARSAPASAYSPRFRSPRNREPLACIADPHPLLEEFRTGRGAPASKMHRISGCRSESNEPIHLVRSQ